MTIADPLIDAATLAELLAAGDPLTLLDVRYRMGGPSGPAEFESGHLPGAAYVDLDASLAAPVRPDRVGGRHPLPDHRVFVDAMRAAGVSGDVPVVVYDDWQGRAAGRAWWLLRHYGHTDVRVLDGGLAAWTGTLESGPATVAPGDFDGSAGHLPTVDADGLNGFDGVVIDAREAPRYRGDEEPVDPVAGHVPGALNAPTSANLREDGTFLESAGLRESYPVAGPVAVYCGSGVTATHDLLALARIGIEGTLYPGSWSDWVSDPDRPVERRVE